MAVNGKTKIKQANKKWRHEQKRRQKARSERVRIAQAVEARGKHNNQRKRDARAYVGALGADLDI